MKAIAAAAALAQVLRLYPGYVTKVECTGRLLISSVGNEAVVRLSALPAEMGCGVLLKPLISAGRTNLILETSAGTIERVIEVRNVAGARPEPRDLDFKLRGDRQ